MKLLRDTIDRDRFPLALRLHPIKSILEGGAAAEAAIAGTAEAVYPAEGRQTVQVVERAAVMMVRGNAGRKAATDGAVQSCGRRPDIDPAELAEH